MDDVKYVLPHDSSNAFLLPPSSSLSKNKNGDGKKSADSTSCKKILSKKQRKKLEKILEKKRRKISRIEILQKLQKHQITQNELNMFQSMARIQQKVPKKKSETESRDQNLSLNTIAGSGKRKFGENAIKISNPGPYFETDSSSSDEEFSLKSAKKEILDDGDDEKPKPDEKVVDKIPLKSQPAIYVHVDRKPEMQENRLKLPILAMEQEIMEKIAENSSIIICGATGSGKTTQIPQFLYESGYCRNGKMIAVTEPRRVAAISMSSRVAAEMNLQNQKIVAYQIRYEGDADETKTKIKFMTDGVLLREFKQDFLLRKYSAILIDEAHERSMFSDILIGLLSRVVNLRRKKFEEEQKCAAEKPVNNRSEKSIDNQSITPLKLIIMSATLRVDDFLQENLFKQAPPPIVNVESRQFPVVVHFNRRTGDDFLNESLKKCRQIHRKLPEGGVLVFLPGRREVLSLISRLKKAFPNKKKAEFGEKSIDKRRRIRSNESETSGKNIDQSSDEEEADFEETSRRKKPINKRRQIRLDDYKIDLDESESLETNFDKSDGEEAELNDDLDLNTDSEEEEMFGNTVEKGAEQPVHVLPLYALLSSQEQKRVFEAPPEGHRLIVVATNVAETSVTIPNIKYVVDSGREKVRLYDPVTGVSKFAVQWVSKASAEQRTGRAGRTSAGHCYRLYSSAVFEEFRNFSQPEILQKPVDDLVLLMKNLNISNVENFPFPTPPSKQVLKAAEERLLKLGALERCQKAESPLKMTKITPLGKTMALLPVAPAFAKMLCLGHQQNLLPYVVCIVAGLSVREPLINLTSLRDDYDSENSSLELRSKVQQNLKIRRQWAGDGENFLLGDVSVLLNAILQGRKCKFDQEFCRNFGFRQKAGLEIEKMRRQICNLIKEIFPETKNSDLNDSDLDVPGQLEACSLRQILLSGQSWQVAKRLPDFKENGRKLDRNAYKCLNGSEEAVFLHPSSILRKNAPDFVIYQEILQSSDKKFMNTVTAIESDWLSECDGNK